MAKRGKRERDEAAAAELRNARERVRRRLKRRAKRRKPRATFEPGDWAPVFLEALTKTRSALRAAKHAGIARRTAYTRRDADPAFRDAWQEVFDEELDLLGESVLTRAIYGTPKPVWHEGMKCGTELRFSVAREEMVLSRMRRWKWGRDAAPTLESPQELAEKIAATVLAMQNAAQGPPPAAPPEPCAPPSNSEPATSPSA